MTLAKTVLSFTENKLIDWGKEFLVKVLIVEDEIYSRQSLIKQVQGFDSDFEILEAANGKKALELFWSEKPELILSDIEMPFVSGLELLQQVASSKGKMCIRDRYGTFT